MQTKRRRLCNINFTTITILYYYICECRRPTSFHVSVTLGKANVLLHMCVHTTTTTITTINLKTSGKEEEEDIVT